MKIFMITRGYPSESNPLLGIFEYEQAKALQKLGHEVIYLSLDLRSLRRKRKMGYYSFSDDGMIIENYSFPIGAVPHDMLVGIGKYALQHLVKKAIKNHGKPDIMHVHFFDMAAITAKCDFGDIPVVVTEHSSQLNAEIPESMIEKYKAAYEKANAVIAVSQDLKKRLYDLLNVDSVCINNMINLSEYSFEEKIDNGEFNFITVAKLDSNKRVDLVIKAFSQFISGKDNARFRLDLIGIGEEEENLRQLVNKLNLDEKVNFHGFMPKEKINKLFHEAGCFVLASKKETFGVACAEALVTGTPVVITKCGGPEEFVDESNGIVVNDDELAAGMNYIYENYDSYDKRAISDCIRECFNEETIARKIEKLYADVICGNKIY